MTQKQLDAGAAALIRIATEHGYGSFVSQDLARQIAAAVYKDMQDAFHPLHPQTPAS